MGKVSAKYSLKLPVVIAVALALVLMLSSASMAGLVPPSMGTPATPLKDGDVVTFTPDFAVTEIQGTAVKGLNYYNNEWHTFSDFDSVVYAMGSRVEDALYKALKGKVKELYRIGDCVAPRKIDMAILEGDKVARMI